MTASAFAVLDFPHDPRSGEVLEPPLAYVADNEPIWRTSTRSGNGGDCVEVAANLAAATGVVLVRDSKDRSGPVPSVPAAGWASFLTAVHQGHFDR